jgi:hypothetical protein
LPRLGLNLYDTTLYAGTERGLYASVDAGAHWVPTGSVLATSRVLSLAADPAAPGTLYAGTDEVVLRSTDGGRNWHGIAPGPNTHIASLLITRGVIFAGTNELLRYPPRGGANIAGTITNLLFLLALGVIGFLLLRRSQKRMAQMEERRRRETEERRARRQSGVEAAHNEPLDEDAEEQRADDAVDDAVRKDATNAAQAAEMGDERQH